MTIGNVPVIFNDLHGEVADGIDLIALLGNLPMVKSELQKPQVKKLTGSVDIVLVVVRAVKSRIEVLYRVWGLVDVEVGGSKVGVKML